MPATLRRIGSNVRRTGVPFDTTVAATRFPKRVFSSLSGPIAKPFNYLMFRSVISMDNAPAAEDFVDSSVRWVTKLDLTNYQKVRMVFRMSQDAVTGATINIKYSTVNPGSSYVGGDWSNISTVSLAIEMSGGRIVQVTPWRDLAAGAKADVYVTGVTVGGDGVDDPMISILEVQFR